MKNLKTVNTVKASQSASFTVRCLIHETQKAWMRRQIYFSTETCLLSRLGGDARLLPWLQDLERKVKLEATSAEYIRISLSAVGRHILKLPESQI